MQVLRRGGWEWRKIRRSFGRKDRDALIQAFERYNGDIAKYVEQREILAPISKPRPAEISKYYHMIRDHASGLYDALEAGWQCRCICAHSANLLLERRDDVNITPGFKLSLSFLHRPSHDHPGQEAWLETEVDVGEWDEDTESDDQHSQDVRTTATRSTPMLPMTTSSLTTNISLPFTLDRMTGRSVRIVEPPGLLKSHSTSGTFFSISEYPITMLIKCQIPDLAPRERSVFPVSHLCAKRFRQHRVIPPLWVL